MRLLFAFMLVLSVSVSFGQKAKLKGVVTYFLNEFQGNKPDVGATVYAVDSSKCLNYNKDISFQFEVQTFQGASQSDTTFQSLDKRNALNNNEIKNSEFVKTTMVDSTGSYSLDLPPGVYYVLIKSKGRTSLSLTEITGKVYLKKVNLHPNQTFNVSYNFRIY